MIPISTFHPVVHASPQLAMYSSVEFQVPIPHHPTKLCSRSQGKGILTKKKKKENPARFCPTMCGWEKERIRWRSSNTHVSHLPFLDWMQAMRRNKRDPTDLKQPAWPQLGSIAGPSRAVSGLSKLPLVPVGTYELRAIGTATSTLQNDIITFGRP